jgi:hypothetical protein
MIRNRMFYTTTLKNVDKMCQNNKDLSFIGKIRNSKHYYIIYCSLYDKSKLFNASKQMTVKPNGPPSYLSAIFRCLFRPSAII